MIVPHDRDYRYEIKFVIDRAGHPVVEHWLAAKPFFRRSFPQRWVHSVYFDNASLRTGQNNFDGIANRQKFRVRWYDDAGDGKDPLALEVKVKNGRLGWKAMARLDLRPSKLLDQPASRIEKIFHADPAVRDLIPREAALQPVMYVTYARSYYLGPQGIRITFDRNLSFADILRDTHTMEQNHRSYEKGVLEFKFPPTVRDQASQLMEDLSFYPTRFSKYVTGLSLFGHAVYL